MTESTLYFGKKEFYDIIKSLGGQWNDKKKRPLVCLIKLSESDNIFWAIPLGNYAHRDKEGQERIQKYMNYDSKDIRSCFYHVGNTDVNSIFFISDLVPITDEYIEKAYIGKYTGEPYIIKNKKLKSELLRKTKRILSWENNNPNYFRQHITSLKNYLLTETNESTYSEVAVTLDK